MNLTTQIIQFLKEKEGLRLKAYQDIGGVWTIGYGNTWYEDKSLVKSGQTITQQRAEQLFTNVLNSFASQVRLLIKTKLNDNQFSALVSFAYNLGTGALSGSTLLRKVNANPSDKTITAEFLRWNKVGNTVVAGLTKRRQQEADIYFSRSSSPSEPEDGKKKMMTFLAILVLAVVIRLLIGK